LLNNKNEIEKLIKNDIKKDLNQPELIHQNCDFSHETEIISHKENWNRSQRIIFNQPSVEW
jgi:hypothetical protein